MLGTDVFGEGAPQGGAIAALTTTLYAFCLLFAVNSAVHSYLIVRYSEGDKVGGEGALGGREGCPDRSGAGLSQRPSPRTRCAWKLRSPCCISNGCH